MPTDGFHQVATKGGSTMLDERLAEYIDVAIGREEDAFAFYSDLAEKVRDKSARDVILWIADEEKKHKAFLVDFKSKGKGPDAMRLSEAVLYNIAEYLEEPEIGENMKSEDVFLVASHRELRSYRFYSELAALYDAGDSARQMLTKIASEELKHKEKMEYLYSNAAFPQTDGG
jgi:rubrerythrin